MFAQSGLDCSHLRVSSFNVIDVRLTKLPRHMKRSTSSVLTQGNADPIDCDQNSKRPKLSPQNQEPQPQPLRHIASLPQEGTGPTNAPSVQRQPVPWTIFFTLKQAEAYWEKNMSCVLLAFDKDEQGAKGYVVTSAEVAAETSALGRAGFRKWRHLYEKLHADRPMRLYYDAEFYVRFNPDKVPQKDEMKQALRYYVDDKFANTRKLPITCNSS